MKPGVSLLAVAIAVVMCGCRAAEPFRLNGGPGTGGIFIMTGSGGSGGFGGAGGSGGTAGGSGGDIGTGGSGGDDDAGSPPTGSGGTGGADMDSGAGGSGGVTDAGGMRDTGGVRDTMPREMRPVGPTTRYNCYAISPWKANTPYKAGDRVFQIADLRVYQCRPWPYEGWCPLPTYEPGDESTGYWRDAWVQLGYCE